MAEARTKVTDASVRDFLDSIESDHVRQDCRVIAGIMRRATGARPRMWGSSIVGFGTYRSTQADGRETDWMLTAFSPRKRAITLYLGAFEGRSTLLARLGTHASGKSCVYIKRLSDIHLPTLGKLVTASVRHSFEAHSAR